MIAFDLLWQVLETLVGWFRSPACCIWHALLLAAVIWFVAFVLFSHFFCEFLRGQYDAFEDQKKKNRKGKC